MVEFGSGAYSPMERGSSAPTHHGHHHDKSPTGHQPTNDVGLSIGDFGMSLGLGPVPNVQAIAAKLRPGTKNLEFVFSGTGKGAPQQQTPGMYGLKQRQALEEMGKANRIDFTTHATFGVYGLAGMDQQGNFSRQSKAFSLNEVKRAIEFASDVARGGPVVVHTGEFRRPVADANWNTQGKWAQKFEIHPDEDERTSYKVVDSRTGRMINEAQKNRKVARPVWHMGKAGKEYFDKGVKKTAKGDHDEEGLPIYLDYFDKRISPEERVPEFDKKIGNFKIEQLGWEDLKKEAKDMTLIARKVWDQWKSGEISDKKYEESYWKRFKDVKSKEDITVMPEEAYIISTLETNAANSRGWAHYYGGSFDEYVENQKKLKKALAFYTELEGATNKEEKWRLKQQINLLQIQPGLIPEDSLYPSEIIKRKMRDNERQMKQSQEASASQWAQAAESVETIRHVQSADTYAFREAADSYARLGLDAMRRTKDLKDLNKLKKPLQVAMENLFPEQYGAHPDELVHLIKKSRERMVELLDQQGVNKEEAQKRAAKHITITFDTGHLNMWRKYWKGDHRKSLAENDKEFDSWMLEKVKTMAPYIGHVHIDDNYGYHDDHLAPGEGNTPIRGMIKTLKENGYKGELIVEPGADYTTDSSGFHSVMKTWRHFGMPVYRSTAGGPKSQRTWSDVGYGFFGQNQPPYFTFGGYSPSEDWTLWSGVPLE